jgi:hypothetical protein
LDGPTESDVCAALQRLDPLWDELFQAEQVRLLGGWSTASTSRCTALSSECEPKG